MGKDLSKEITKRFERAYAIGETPWMRNDIPLMAKKFAKLLKKEYGNPKLLDIGCGNGWISVHFAGKGVFVEGIDSSKEGIRLARKSAREKRLSNVNFKIGDAVGFPYKEKSFDAVFDRGLLHHVPERDWGRYLKGLLKVLKDYGFFCLSVFSDKAMKGGYSPKAGRRMWVRRKDSVTGYWTYDHFFNDKLIKEIFGKYFDIIERDEDPARSDHGSQEIRYIFKRKII